jgi:glycosyltransferase involved in cell wall biosynthesis
LRIGIDAHVLGKNKGGVERYVKEMVSFLPDLMPEDHFFVFVTKRTAHCGRPRPNVTFIKLPFSDPLLQRTFALPVATFRYKLDIVHVQRILPLFFKGTAVVTVHDLLPIVHPEDHPGIRNRLIRMLTGHGVRRSGRVLTVSRSVRAEIIKMFRITPHKCNAIYNGIDHDHFRCLDGTIGAGNGGKETEENINLLYIGAIEPRKNLDTVLRALDILHTESSQNITLTIVGGVRDQKYADHVERMVIDLGLQDRVAFLGYVPDTRCLELIRAATVFLAPSKGEGFDLPPVEAMACGVPVICSDIPVHREILDNCAVFFPALSAEKLTDCIRALVHDRSQRRRLQENGKALAKTFTWKETACRIAEVYRAIGQERAA